MAVKTIPNRTTRLIRQVNRGNKAGDLFASRNLDLLRELGSIKFTRMLLNTTSDAAATNTEANMGLPFAFSLDSAGTTIAGCGTTAFFNDGTPYDPFTETSNQPADVFNPSESDIAFFNDSHYATEGGADLYKTTGGGAPTWSTVDTGATANRRLVVFDNNLYFSHSNNIVGSMSEAEAFSYSGAARTIDLADNREEITFLIAGRTSIWIGVVNRRGGNGAVYEWDGVTQNGGSIRYEIDAEGALAGVIKNNTPYVMDTMGRLLRFNGSGFVEIARLPKRGRDTFVNILDGSVFDTYIHYNGMTLVEDEVNILVAPLYEDSAPTTDPEFPAGIWEYIEGVGLYHKHSLGIKDSTIEYDYGQLQIAKPGALIYDRIPDTNANKNGTLIAGATYYTDATTTESGIFYNDIEDVELHAGTLTTTRIYSNDLTDVWQQVGFIYDEFAGANDRIDVKFRTVEDTHTEATITWTDTDTFTSTDNLSAYVVGDEVEIVRGRGSGQCAHITAISEAGGTYTVDLDRTIVGASATNTAKAHLAKWKLIKTLDRQNRNHRKAPITKGNTGPWIQVKLYCELTSGTIDEIIVKGTTGEAI